MVKVNFWLIGLLLTTTICCRELNPKNPEATKKAAKNEIHLMSEIFKLGLDTSFLDLTRQPVFAVNSFNVVQKVLSRHTKKPILFADTLTSNLLLSDTGFTKDYQLFIYNQYSVGDTITGLITDRTEFTTYIFYFLLENNKLKFIRSTDVQPKFGYPKPFNNDKK